MKPKYLLKFTLVLIVSLALCACGLSPFGITYHVDETRTYAPDGINIISVSDISCPITVLTGTDTVSARLAGSCTGTTGPLNVQMQVQDALLSIKVEYPDGIHNNDCKLTLTLPASYTGSLTIQNVSGIINADALTNELDAVSIDTVSANCSLTGVHAGRIQYNGVSGDLTVNGAVQNGLIFDTTSGDAEITGLNGHANVNTISGNMTLAFDHAGDVSFHSTSGDITLYLPANSGFSLDFDSVSGQFDSDFPIRLSQSGTHTITGTSGEGGVRLSLETVSGDAGVFGR